jgi:putative protein-disulfide isomerase
MKPQIIYCYDAYCCWCFGFSTTIHAIASKYLNDIDFELLSGGMVLTKQPVHIEQTASFWQQQSKLVTAKTNVKFGEDFLWHIINPSKSDWYPNSLLPAIALCIFKEYYPKFQILFAIDLQKSLFEEGRDLTDSEAYTHLLEKYKIPKEDFLTDLKNPKFIAQAHQEFDICLQLKATSYPYLLLKKNNETYHLLTNGYCSFETLDTAIKLLL